MKAEKTAVILQSNYIPWKGYFDLIAAADIFIFYDDVQFTKNDWRNRNRIKTPRGTEWLSVPVGQNTHRTVREVKLTDSKWQRSHWDKLTACYGKAPHFAEIAEWLRALYLETTHHSLSAMNRAFIAAICAFLRIETPLRDVCEFTAGEGRSQRLVDLCEEVGATRYLSGPAARDYLDRDLFAARNIEVAWFDYSGYPEYGQSWGAFDHFVTIVDLLVHCGRDSGKFMKAVS